LAASEGETILITVPDREIQRVVQELSKSPVAWPQKTVLHCSGLLPSAVLLPLKKEGAAIGSLHPAQSVCRKRPLPGQFRNVYFGLEGERRSLVVARKIVKALEGHPLILRPEDKPLYHAACGIASNYFVVVLETAVSLLRGMGLSEELAGRVLFPLVEGTLRNAKEFGVEASLTGPIVRGDIGTLRAHLKALRDRPSVRRIYFALGLRALDLARKGGVSPQKVRSLRKLLEGR
jgi:predicted short-subunit dehydrogenase-like oxidoreductase (DUF2520 family)